jgi:hypothetical protein
MESLKASAEMVVEKAKETAEYLKPKLEAAFDSAKPVAEKIFNEYPRQLFLPLFFPTPSCSLLPQSLCSLTPYLTIMRFDYG